MQTKYILQMIIQEIKIQKKIRKEILKYCPKGIEISDRKIAIKTAIKNMLENNTLILAGKGHEKYQIFKNKRVPFDDSKVAKEAIDKKRW